MKVSLTATTIQVISGVAAGLCLYGYPDNAFSLAGVGFLFVSIAGFIRTPHTVRAISGSGAMLIFSEAAAFHLNSESYYLLIIDILMIISLLLYIALVTHSEKLKELRLEVEKAKERDEERFDFLSYRLENESLRMAKKCHSPGSIDLDPAARSDADVNRTLSEKE